MEPDRPSKPTRRQALAKVWANVQVLMAGRMYRLWLLSAISIVGGFAEAAVLYLVVRIAVALAGGQSKIDFHLGPVHTHLSLTETVLLGAFGVLLITLLALFEVVLSARMSADVLTDSRKSLFADFVRATWSVQSMEREGQLQELMTTYVARVAASIAIFTGGLISAFNFLALLTSALLVDPVAAGGSLIGFVLVFLMLRPLVRMSKTASRHNAAVNSAYARRMTQSVSLAREVHVFDVGEQLIGEVNTLADDARASTYRTRILAGMTSEVYRNVTLLIVLLGMGAAYAIGLSEVSQLGAVVLLLVRSLSYSQQVQGSVQAAAELAPYLDSLHEQQESYRANRADRTGRRLGPVEHLELSGVDFAYTPGHPVLQEVTFAADRGAVVGIVGPSGSGKSTLVQVLLRLRVPDAGRFAVNGVPAGEFALDSWYDEFVFVPQDNRLLLASVADNIAFYRPGVDRAQVERAAELAHIRDEVEQLPEGFDTVIGPGGHDLSGGQKQRLGLARALVGRPSVLVLDEPTSALDLRSEQLVQQTLKDLRGEVTLFIVAHRLSTLSICDHVLVLRDGWVEGFGAPDDLSRTDGFYREALQILASSERTT